LGEPYSIIMLAVEHADPSIIRACIYCAVSPDRVATFGMLAVSPAHQSRGVASVLVRHAQEYVVEQWGATRLRAFVVMKQLALAAWYERLGFARRPEK
ncbi:hypothetical protein AURDEDRAFT_40353, partial [Auricularia subglabra TFB-10046 SS5]